MSNRSPFFFDPDHDNSLMEALEIGTRQRWRGAFVARKNMRINLIWSDYVLLSI